MILSCSQPSDRNEVTQECRARQRRDVILLLIYREMKNRDLSKLIDTLRVVQVTSLYCKR